MGPKMITHTHILLFGNYFPNYTEHLLHRALWQDFYCVVRAPSLDTHCERVNYRHYLSWNYFSNNTHLCYTKELIVSELFV